MHSGALRTLIPVEPQPGKIAADRCDHALLGARGIGILNAQHEAAGVALRQQKIEQRRARISQMQRARGARRKARDNGVLRHFVQCSLTTSAERSALDTLFISDLHLDASEPAAGAQFIDFLSTRAAGAEALYILGDLFETW